VVNSGISTGTLLWAWELYQPVMERLRLDLPETAGFGGLPDVLREIRWNLDWMLTLQDADGGVWHKQTSEQFCGFVMPADDHLPSFVIGTGAAPYKSTAATADLASVAATAARCYRAYDAAYADQCLAAARRAWIWAMSHPDVAFSNPPGVSTGGYGDAHLGDELLWASAELWRTTGEAQYGQAFGRGVGSGQSAPGGLGIAAPSWGDVGPMAYWTYCLAQREGRSGDAALVERIVTETRTEAARLVAQGRATGYGNTLRVAEYGWGSNATAANQSLLLLLSDRLERNPEAVEAAYGNLDYLLGRNCFGVSWVTQVGTRPFLQPHHRPSAADGIAAPWPGLLSGGPNAHPADPVARTLAAGPPMRMWVDDARAYSMNEIAINWNAPLVFMLAGLQG
jgi:endoglucanase